MRAHLFVNPISGRGRARRVLPEVVSLLERRGVSVGVSESLRKGDAWANARALGDGCDLAVAMGGDGTLNEVANGLAGRAIPVGLVPMGTGNVMAKEYRIPRDPRRAVEVLLRGRTLALDVGLAAGRRFLLMAGVGVDGEIVRRLHATRTGSMTFFHYVRPALVAARAYGFPPFSLEIDGERVAGNVRMAVVGNTRAYGGPFEFTPRAAATDGLFDVCALAGGPRGGLRIGHLRDFLRFFYGAIRGTILGVPGVVYRFGRTVRVEGPGVPIQIDGELAGTTPAEFTLSPRAFTLVVP